jgi:hypothetical protein
MAKRILVTLDRSRVAESIVPLVAYLEHGSVTERDVLRALMREQPAIEFDPEGFLW